ncbi:hypothetical protein QOZ80_9AG0677040 [Eleusine coracana subsp. coracana]|nr:hypothetical protein QOZ80_9AG0677040 [Eleusine coracana subsp. coracana]
MDTTEPNHISHKLLEDLTDGYSKERLLGRGAFGAVYRGEDKDGHRIAVKVLLTTDIEDKEFLREFKNLRKLNHPNIIRLVGFCSEEEELLKEYNGQLVVALKRHRALCFEYMENGSLEKYISDDVFVWQKQFEIIKGICEGLKYLHMGLEEPMKHLDLKPGNILLDKNMIPKIADFGLSKLVGEKNTIKTLSTTGSLGYLPPEFIMYQITSKEFDIYSLGVIILKIMIGAKGYSALCDMESDESNQYVLVYTKWEERQEKKSRRPNIGYIVDQLNEIEKVKNSSAYKANEVASTKISSPDMATDASGEKPSARQHNTTSTVPQKLPAKVLKDITNNFSPQNIRGQSVFGTIYEGNLPGGGSIAVKRLAQDSIVQHFSVFDNEYLAKGTIDKYIYDKTSIVDWNTRFQIIKGICQDDNWLPKITDFGHSRLFSHEQTRKHTMNVKGQIGYMAPEYLYRGEISTMSDIYSLGMIILETTTGQKHLPTPADRASRKFVENIQNNWKKPGHITDKYPSLEMNGYNQVRACILIGLKCVEVDRKNRPSIVDIIDGLNGKSVKIFDEEFGG